MVSDAHVCDGKFDNWAAKSLEDGQRAIIIEADERGGAPSEIDANTRWSAKELHDCFHGLDVVRLGMAV